MIIPTHSSGRRRDTCRVYIQEYLTEYEMSTIHDDDDSDVGRA